MIYESTGTLRIFTDNSVKVMCDKGLLEYYKHLVDKRFWLKTQYPRHGPHITIIHPKYHKDVRLKRINYLDKKIVNFTYDPYIYIGGIGKGFRNFWIKVDCPISKKIKKKLKVKDSKNFLGDHITICNTKNNN